MKTIAAILAIAIATMPLAVAQPGVGTMHGDAPANVLTMNPGFSVLLALDRPFKTITVGDPDLIEATAETDRTITLRASAGKTGKTNVLVVGEGGIHVYSAAVVVSEAGGVRVYSFSSTKNADAHSYRCTKTDCAWLDKPSPAAPIIVMTPPGPLIQQLIGPR